MSLFSLQINFEKSKLPQNVLNEVARIIGESLPEYTKNVTGNVADGTNIFWQGNTDDAIIVNVQTVQNLNANINQNFVSALTKYLSEATGISKKRIIINLLEKVYSDVAINNLQLLRCM